MQAPYLRFKKILFISLCKIEHDHADGDCGGYKDPQTDESSPIDLTRFLLLALVVAMLLIR